MRCEWDFSGNKDFLQTSISTWFGFFVLQTTNPHNALSKLLLDFSKA